MSLKSTFLAFKKICKSFPNWRKGGGGEFGQNPKEQQLFFLKPSLRAKVVNQGESAKTLIFRANRRRMVNSKGLEIVEKHGWLESKLVLLSHPGDI